MKTPALRLSSKKGFVEPLESRIAPASLNPTVLSISRSTPLGADTGVGSVVYAVTFSEAVTGVDATDFLVVTTGDAKASSPVVVTGSGASYSVTIDGLQGNGDVQLKLVDDDTILGSSLPPGPQEALVSTFPLGGPGLNNGSFAGEIYHLLQTGPKVTGIAPRPLSGTTATWDVTFSEDVTGVDATDFLPVYTGSAAGSSTLNVVKTDGSHYTVSVTGVTGTGTVGMNLVDDGSIKDADKNPLQAKTISFDGGNSSTVGSSAHSVATADLNGDGKADLVVSNYNSGSVSVLLGTGDGTFQPKDDYSVGNNPRTVVVADVNGDGKPDIVTTDYTFKAVFPNYTFGSVSVLLGNGDGTFQADSVFGSPSQHLSVAVADLNADGKPDIVQTTQSSVGVVTVLLNNNAGGFTPTASYAVGSNPGAVAIGDVDGDGKVDIVTANNGAGTVSVLLGNGNGTFQNASSALTGSGPTGVALADVNGDGKTDIITSNGNSLSVSVLLNLSSSTGFVSLNDPVDYTNTFIPSGVALTDVDGDGILDIVVSNGEPSAPNALPEQGLLFTTNIGVFKGNGDGTFGSVNTFGLSSNGSTGVAIGDFNGDGRADVSTADGATNTASVFLNTGEGGYTGGTITLTANGPDLSVTSVSDAKTSAAPGELLTYTINYANVSLKNATGVKLTSELNSELNFVASENPGWTLSNGILSKTVGNLNGSSTGSVTLKLHVNNTITSGYSGFGQTVTIGDDGANGDDPNTGNQSQSDYDSLTGLNADLVITKITDPTLAVQGNLAYITVSYNNLGNWGVSSAKLTVTLPEGTSFNSSNSDSRWVNNGDGTISLPGMGGIAVPAGQADQSVTFAVEVPFFKGAPSPLVTTATISTAFGFPTETNTNNNTKMETTPVYGGFYVTSPGIAVAGRYAPPVIRVFDMATGDEVYNFLAYEPRFRDSIRVALADIDGDGVDDIITTTAHGTGRLRAFNGLNGEQFTTGVFGNNAKHEIAVFDGRREIGAFVAAGNLDGIFGPEIIVGSALGGGRVKVFTIGGGEQTPSESGSQAVGPTFTLLKSFTPFGAKFRGGVRVATGDLDGFTSPNAVPENIGFGFEDDLIVGQGYRGGTVIAYKGYSDTVLQTIQIGGPKYRGGVAVAAGDVDGDGRADIVVGRNTGRPSIVEIFSGRTGEQIGNSINPFDTDPNKPRNAFGVRVATADVNYDGIADIITSVGILNKSLVRIYDGRADMDGTYHLLESQPDPIYSKFPNVALWVAGSQASFSRG